jgi:lipopolysaccharide export system permease protein
MPTWKKGKQKNTRTNLGKGWVNWLLIRGGCIQEIGLPSSRYSTALQSAWRHLERRRGGNVLNSGNRITASGTRPRGPAGFRWRPPWLLYGYIANELLAPFFASFLILFCVFFLVRLVPLLEVVLSLHIGLADFIRLIAYIFPHMLLYLIPMASMAGVIIGFTRLTGDGEILALKSCGVSLKQMLPPVLVIATAIACLTGLFSIRFIPAGALGMKQLMFELAKKKIDKGLQPKEFTEALGDIVVYVDAIDDQKRWHGVFISDMRGRNQPLITVAQTGHMEADMERMLVMIILENGTLHNYEGTDNQVIRFGRYQLHISLRPPTQVGNEDVTSMGRGTMTQKQLIAAAATLPSGSKVQNIYLSEYYHRLTLPVGCLILSLIGLPLGLQAAPGRRAVGIPIGLTVFVTYYIILTTAENMSENGLLPMVLGMWLPNILFALLALFLFHRVHQEKPLIPDAIQHVLHLMYHHWLHPQGQRFVALARRFMPQLFGRRRATIDSSHQALNPLVIHADGATRLFHLPNCRHYHDPNCRLRFKDAKIAEESGFSPCPLCAPSTSVRKTDQKD